AGAPCRTPSGKASAAGAAPDEAGPPVRSAPAALLCAAGAAAMVCEVAWTRAFALLLGSTTYAFTVMLVTFLLGLALGSLAFHNARRRLSPTWKGLAWVFAATALGVCAGLYLFDRLPYLFVRLYQAAEGKRELALPIQFVLCAGVMLPPAALMGAVFPWALAAARPGRVRIGSATGGYYAANTIGAIMGSAGAGLLLLPAAGPQGCLIAAVWTYAACALLSLALGLGLATAPAPGATPRPAPKRRLALATAFGAAALLAAATWLRPEWDPRLLASGVFIYAPHFARASGFGEFRKDLSRDRVLLHSTGRNATVTVFEDPWGERYMRVNGKTDASEGGDMGTQLLLGYLPLLVHGGEPRRALVVGLGAGLTAGALASEPRLEAIEAVEIESAVVDGARMFSRANRGVLADPRLRLRLADARQFLAAPGGRYDIISSEPSNPWIAGIAYLYTQEAFALARDRLEEDGVFCQWFHSYFMTEEDFRMVVRTFLSVFPHAMLMSNGEADYFLLGSKSPWSIDYAALLRAFSENPALRQDLPRLGPGFDHPFTLMTSTFVLGDADLRRYAQGAPLHTDDRPTLEFSAARSIHFPGTDIIRERLRDAKTVFLPEGLRGLRITDRERALVFNKTCESLLNAGLPERARQALSRAMEYGPRDARTWTNAGRLRLELGRPKEALRAFRKAVALDPRDARARIRLGQLLAAGGRNREALAHFKEALALSPEHPLASLEAGRMYLDAGRDEDARRVLGAALRRPIPDSGVRRRLAEALRRAGGQRTP
ncbi:MAG: tetratricopeptide repeat protein, partial [Elusimicrobiota bacterium]